MRQTMETQPEHEESAMLSRLMITLLKGAVYKDDDESLWAGLLRHQADVRQYARVLLLDLVIDEAEGYAFLRSRQDSQEDSNGGLPRLVARRPLTFQVSLLLVLLRRRMAEFDAAGGQARLVLTREEIVDLVRIFWPQSANEARIADQVDAAITKAVELGFLRKLKPGPLTVASQPSYEVRRILKAFVNAQWLADFDANLEAYRRSLQEQPDGDEQEIDHE